MFLAFILWRIFQLRIFSVTGTRINMEMVIPLVMPLKVMKNRRE